MSEQCDAAPMGALSDEHQRLAPFEGVFKAEVKMWMGPGDPLVSTGVMTNAFDLGGRFLRQEYKGDQADGPFPNFEGRGYWGFNTNTKKFEGFWIDSASTFMQTEVGDVDSDGKVWEMVGNFTPPGSSEPMQKRSVIKIIDRDHHSMEMYVRDAQGSETKTMEIQYRRAK